MTTRFPNGLRRGSWLMALWAALASMLLAACSDSSYIAATPAPLAASPTITQQPASLAVNEGQAAAFSVTADGTGPLTYQWQRNGQPIPGAGGATYQIAAASMADAGAQFSVVVSNTAGSVTSNPATLNVNPVPQAPAITQQPANVTVAAGQMATFAVVATGSAPLAYQWQRNGTPIPGATGASYTTAATTAGDNGATFRVVVSNGMGSATSNDATLTVTTGSAQPPAGLVCEAVSGSAQCWAHPRPQGDGINDVAFIDANTGIAASSNTLLRTTDGGTSWTVVARAAAFDTAFVSVRYATALIAVAVGGNGVIVRSIDGGLTWNAVSSGTTQNLRALRFASATTGVAVGVNRILRTTDGGATWTTASSANDDWQDVAVSGNTFVAIGGTNGIQGRFARSDDGGATWSAGNLGTTAGFFGVAFVPGSATVIAVGASGAMRRSLDGGANWAAASSGSSAFLRTIAFTDANTGLIGGVATILRTTNGGANWASVPANTPKSIAVVAWRDATQALALGDSGVQRSSSDAGATWSGFVPATVEDMYAAAFNGVSTLIAADVTGAVLRSTDGGVNWSANATGVSAFPNAATFVDANVALIVGDGGKIARSVDAGITWAQPASGAIEALYDVAMASATVGVAIGANGTIVRTSDGGSSWNAVASGTNNNLFSVRFASAQVGIIVGDGVVLRTTDGGASWNAITVPAIGDLTKVRFASPTVGLIGGSLQSLRTTDGGATWTAINHPMNLADLARFEFTSATTGRGLMASPSGLSIVTTVDAGATWTATAPLAPAQQYSFEVLLALSHSTLVGVGQIGFIGHLTLP